MWAQDGDYSQHEFLQRYEHQLLCNKDSHKRSRAQLKRSLACLPDRA